MTSEIKVETGSKIKARNADCLFRLGTQYDSKK